MIIGRIPVILFMPIISMKEAQYVPCLTNENNKTILGRIPLHGDQLFEERARNVIWTCRDGIDDYERLEGISTEFANWHAKFTLYKVTNISTTTG